MATIYFASPFFNPEQVERERRLVTTLRELGFEVFAPSESCILPPDASEELRNKVYQENIDNLSTADICFCVTDGKDIGTIWEAGFFSATKYANEEDEKKLVYYCETLGDHAFNVMLAKSGDLIYTSFEQFKNNFVQDIEEDRVIAYVGKIQ